jgi:hypothetical protein
VFEHEKRKTFCRPNKCMKVLHCRGLPMVAMIEKQQQQGKELFVAISWQGDHSERNNSRRRV